MLENADSFTLFSVNPDPDFEHKAKATFQNHEIFGQVKIRSAATRKELIDALNEGISAAGGVAGCFNPRHAIRAKKGSETVELLICFECGVIEITTPWSTNVFPTTAAPAATFNYVLNQAAVPRILYCAPFLVLMAAGVFFTRKRNVPKVIWDKKSSRAV